MKLIPSDSTNAALPPYMSKDLNGRITFDNNQSRLSLRINIQEENVLCFCIALTALLNADENLYFCVNQLSWLDKHDDFLIKKIIGHNQVENLDLQDLNLFCWDIESNEIKLLSVIALLKIGIESCLHFHFFDKNTLVSVDDGLISVDTAEEGLRAKFEAISQKQYVHLGDWYFDKQ